ncbi:DUF4268 domain-containing protein [Flavobacteriaceae bacterium]|nr:DUF4268 domain-containing protein [Flavobacteriaceae bacterium]
MKLGNLEKINLREVWAREDTHFTQWLAKEENISVLLDEIGVSAENIKTEDNAGKFNCDITADEVESGKKIIIENQLEKTDHSHLGQLLTYASSFDASIIVWVVADTRDEHKQAIEWFNKNMTENISFFLVKIEVWKIGDSIPAPKFNIVVEPNDWAKITSNKGTTNKELTDTKLEKLKFWEELKDYSENNPSKLRITRKPRPQHWYSMSIGIRHIGLNFIHNTKNNSIAVDVYINKQDIYDKIQLRKDFFESICGELELEWLALPEKKASRILASRGCDLNNETLWEEYFKWFIQTGETLLTAINKSYK